MAGLDPRRLALYNLRDLDRIPQVQQLSEDDRFAMKVVAHVLPFRTNSYLVEELIDWSRVPDDPIFQLTFPQPGMLDPVSFERMATALRGRAPDAEIAALADDIRLSLNPHPAGQTSANVPLLNDERVPGMQHKYRETALIFPAHGQTCHSYCSFCFRWPQFVGLDALKFATDASRRFQDYLRVHSEITDVLITGGDPMIMGAAVLAAYVEPLLGAEFAHVRSIRIGTKSVAFWPYRYVTDSDADAVLRLFERVVASGRHLSIMAHYSHPVELSTPIAREAVRRIRATGAQIRCQSPLIRRINDAPGTWVELWQTQVELGCVPYYLFVERDTGAKGYFEVPIFRAWNIFREAFQRVSGLARTVRGPSMSTLPGKIVVEGVAEIHGEPVFVLEFLQARNPDWCRRPFFARFDPTATWLSDLQPAFGEEKFFFEDELDAIVRRPAAEEPDRPMIA